MWEAVKTGQIKNRDSGPSGKVHVVFTTFCFLLFCLQDIGDATSVSLLNLDPSEHTPEVIKRLSIIFQ